jgi:uncharacterized SAM-binding protein YcdF (DUF218 family)
VSRIPALIRWGVPGLVAAGVLGWLLMVVVIALFGRRDEAREADVIVVLGAAQYDGRPSPVLRARVDHAVELYERGLAPLLILTGGVGRGDTVSEAVVGSRYAARRGVPAQALMVERHGLRTTESMRAVARFMEHEGLESAILVSDPFHMLRLRIIARRHGIEAVSSPTRTSPITGEEEEWRQIVRESFIVPVLLLLGDTPADPRRWRQPAHPLRGPEDG